MFYLRKKGYRWRTTDDVTMKTIYEPKNWGEKEACRKLHGKELLFRPISLPSLSTCGWNGEM
jgi:hypothetical protein